MNVNQQLAAMKKLRAAGLGSYVVLTREAGKAGLCTRFPIGEIVGFSDTFSVRVRKLGHRRAGGYAAGFWEPAPKRLVSYLFF